MDASSVIDAYTDCDREAVLAIFDSNVPAYFSVHERELLGRFVDELPGPAWVARATDGEVVGFGAVSQSGDGVAWLRWGMVAQGQHRRGVGKALLNARLDWIRDGTEAQFVRVATTEPVMGFFVHMGFTLERVVRDGIEPGVDRYDLVYCSHT